ncbi:MAG: leucine-rich repeat domain-containing protein [Firmicutes bacterium]|nr:leucine-rich repeat domain-containing protein [Bacillota bacterium]
MSEYETIHMELCEGSDELCAEFTEYQVSGSGGVTVIEPGVVSADYVTFYDYDGTVLYSYTREDAAALEALPDLPSHDGLVAEAWNYTLDEIRSGAPADVAASFMTDDGATRFYITVSDTVRSSLSLRISCTDAGGVSIDWGDGSDAEKLTSTDETVYTHEYGAVGDYVISVTANSGTWRLIGESVDAGGSAFGYTTTSAAQRIYPNMLTRAEFGSGVEEIGDYSLSWCGNLETVTFPTGIVYIGEYALRCCYSLKFLGIPRGVRSVGTYLCAYCEGLAALSIPPTITELSQRMCYSCISLLRAAPPEGITSFGALTFYGCSSLRECYIPSTVLSLGNYSFEACYRLRSIRLCENLTSCGTYCFHGCRSITSFSFPDSFQTIGDYALYGCSLLSDLYMPEGLTAIGARAFYECVSLSKVTVPSSVTSIGNYAFYGCRSVHDYYVYAKTPPDLGGTAVFSGIASDSVIHVPEASLEAYQSTTRWSSLTSYLVGDL